MGKIDSLLPLEEPYIAAQLAFGREKSSMSTQVLVIDKLFYNRC